MKHIAPLVTAALGTALPSIVRADDLAVSFGVCFELRFAGGPAVAGVGLDLRGGYSERRDDGYRGGGVFLNGMFLQQGAARLALGGFYGFAADGDVPTYGFELGWAYRDGGHALNSGHGLHLGALIQAGGVAEGHLRGTFYGIPDVGFEGEIILGAGLRFPDFIRPLESHVTQEGRPYRVAGHVLRPRVRVGERARVSVSARAWIEDARDEAASVPAFEVLAWQLGALGAPDTLVRRARRAAREEVRHANACALRAAEQLGTRVAIERLRPVARPVGFAELVHEAWHDGVLNEGAAAARARRSKDPVHRMIAHDEAGHAELAWDCIRFALAHGGDAARDALAHARAHSPAPADLASEEAHERAALL